MVKDRMYSRGRQIPRNFPLVKLSPFLRLNPSAETIRVNYQTFQTLWGTDPFGNRNRSRVFFLHETRITRVPQTRLVN